MTKMFKIDEPLFISNIDDDTKQLNMFERYIVTEHNRKIETFEKFKKFKSLGYDVKYIWETDWKKFNDGIDKIPNILNYI